MLPEAARRLQPHVLEAATPRYRCAVAVLAQACDRRVLSGSSVHAPYTQALLSEELATWKGEHAKSVEELQRQTAEHVRGLEREQAAAARGVAAAAEGDEARRQLRAQEAE